MSLVRRRNLISNPIGDNVASTSNLDYLRVTPSVQTGFIRLTISDALVTTFGQRIAPSPVFGLTAQPGRRYRVIGEGRSDVTVPDLGLRLNFFTSGQVLITSVSNTTTVNATSSTFTTLSPLVVRAPDGTGLVVPSWGIPGGGARSVGQIFDFRRILIEEATTGDYFNGSTADTGQYDYSWVGTAELSQSIEAKRVATVLNQGSLRQAAVRAATI